jgi:hypothetical protein
LAVVAVAPPLAEVLLAALLLLEPPQPVKPMVKAATAIATPLMAVVRFIEIAPVDPGARGRLSQEQRTPIASVRNLRVFADVLRLRVAACWLA